MENNKVEEKKDYRIEAGFEKLAITLTRFAGSTTCFVIAFSIVLLWTISGPIFKYSQGWQLFINTGTTIVTFLMVFLIQRTQNKDSLAIQLKLNEIIASISGASNRLIDVEDFSERELEKMKTYYNQLSILMEKDSDLKKSHSIEDTERKLNQNLPTKNTAK